MNEISSNARRESVKRCCCHLDATMESFFIAVVWPFDFCLPTVRIFDGQTEIIVLKFKEGKDRPWVRDKYALVLTAILVKEISSLKACCYRSVENVNKPIILKPYQTSITIREDSGPVVLTSFESTDLDEGPYGQLDVSMRPLAQEPSTRPAHKPFVSMLQLSSS